MKDKMHIKALQVFCEQDNDMLLTKTAAKGVLDLINRQKAEIDDLKRDTIPKLEESLKRANKYGLEADRENEKLKAEIERIEKIQKPTETSGFHIKNGNIVFYTNILNGYRYEYKSLDEVVKELNLMLHQNYSSDEIISHYKGKLESAKAEIERLQRDNFIKSQKRANIFEIADGFERGRTAGIKEFAERLKENVSCQNSMDFEDIDNLLTELTEK